MRIGLVACAKQKRKTPSEARYLYTSPLFRAASDYCERTYDRWYILSAKYGLVVPDTVITPYDQTLNDMKPDERLAWALEVQRQIYQLPTATFYFHAGRRYRENLQNVLHCEVPLAHLGIGQQLAWYEAHR